MAPGCQVSGESARSQPHRLFRTRLTAETGRARCRRPARQVRRPVWGNGAVPPRSVGAAGLSSVSCRSAGQLRRGRDVHQPLRASASVRGQRGEQCLARGHRGARHRRPRPGRARAGQLGVVRLGGQGRSPLRSRIFVRLTPPGQRSTQQPISDLATILPDTSETPPKAGVNLPASSDKPVERSLHNTQTTIGPPRKAIVP